MTWTKETLTFKNFFNSFEDGLYNLNPEHQRDVVHNDEWKSGIIRSSLKFGDIPPVYFHTKTDDTNLNTYDSLDGKQRCSAIIEYMKNEFEYKCTYPESFYRKKYDQLSSVDKQKFNNCKIDTKIHNTEMSLEDIQEFFADRQSHKTTTLGEHLNSMVASSLRCEFITQIK